MTLLTTLSKYMSSLSQKRYSKDIDIDIADILGQKYRYRIDIGNGDIVPPLIDPPVIHHFQLDFYVVYICVTVFTCIVTLIKLKGLLRKVNKVSTGLFFLDVSFACNTLIMNPCLCL